MELGVGLASIAKPREAAWELGTGTTNQKKIKKERLLGTLELAWQRQRDQERQPWNLERGPVRKTRTREATFKPGAGLAKATTPREAAWALGVGTNKKKREQLKQPGNLELVWRKQKNQVAPTRCTH